jgi:hypothetical protein
MSFKTSLSMQLREGAEHSKNNFLFISMYTESYAHLAKRLANSMKIHGLPFAIYEVPTVHNSISEKGSNDLSYTKSNFIRNVISRTNKNIIYIDCDCEIKKFPSLFFEIASNHDFAIYNWLSSQENNVYLPYQIDENSATLYKYSHSIQPACDTQLICSGAVQFWANNKASIELLKYWQNIIENNKGAADDYCLDFSFNNFDRERNNLRYYWLPKSYARYAWWIFEQPVIDHPQIPNISTKWHEINDSEGKKRFYPEHFHENHINKYENKYDGVINPEKNLHINLLKNGNINANVIENKIWITRSAS